MLGSLEVRGAKGVDDDPHAVRLELVVALLGGPVEAERVLEARAPTALDRDPKHRGVAVGLVRLQLLDLGGRPLGQRNDGEGLFEGCHEPILAAVPERLNPPFRARLCDTRCTHR